MCLLYKRKVKKVIHAAEDFLKQLDEGKIGLNAETLIKIDDMTPEEAYILGTKDTMDDMLNHLKSEPFEKMWLVIFADRIVRGHEKGGR